MEQKRQSLESVGIGANGSSVAGGVDTLPRLIPEGAISMDESVYDCIVYLIYCPEHEKIAVSSFEKAHCVWLPFIMLPDNVTWERASRDGVNILIGRDDAEMDADEAEKMAPDYLMSYLHIQRVELPTKTFIRITQFVHLKKNPFFQCCQDTVKVNWVSSADVLNNRLAKVWGPELKILSSMLMAHKPHIISEYTLSHALSPLYAEKGDEHKLLQDMRMTDKKVRDIFNDFVEHCYPSLYMCFESFRAYFIRRGHPRDEAMLALVFNAFFSQNRTYLDFHEFLAGMLAMEPSCPAAQFVRLRLIARFADKERKGFLNLTDLMFVLKSNDPATPEEQIIALMENVFGRENLATNRMDHATFIKILQGGGKHQLGHVCRSPQSIVSQILKTERSSTTSKARDFGNVSQLKSTRKTKGTCNYCRTQQYDYANHMVTLDTTGRSVEPKIISQQWCDPDEIMDSKVMSRERYSLEYAFSISSVPNIFLDLVRDFHYHKSSQLTGLMSQAEDRSTFAKYLRILCTELAGLLQPQLKLIKINAPCVVVGDIQGNLNDLLRMEKMFFQSFPVIPENLVFLGNYSGEYPYGVECLIYLFSLKMSAPNKVFLLRGTRELGEEDSMVLKKECIKKYGDALGKDIYGLFHNIFVLLPAAAIVDETILCVHSGLPKINNLGAMFKMKAEINHPKSEAPMMYDMITRYPNTKANEALSRADSRTRSVEHRSDYELRDEAKPVSRCKSAQSVLQSPLQSPAKSMKSGKSNTSLKSSASAAMKSAAKSTKSSPKSQTGGENIFGPFASAKSDSHKTLTKIKLFKSFKSFKSMKSLKSGKTVVCIKFKSATLRAKSGECHKLSFKSVKSKSSKSNKSNKSQKSTSNKYNFPKHKLKPAFLQSKTSLRAAFKNLKTISAKTQGPAIGGGTNKLDLTIGKRSKVYDKGEFDDFLHSNGLAFVIRSHSICETGYKLTFDRKCVTIFSCAHFNKTHNGAAVALIDSSNGTIRFVRFDMPKSDANR